MLGKLKEAGLRPELIEGICQLREQYPVEERLQGRIPTPDPYHP